ncbi:unnamed protein product [Echinostoma caproni]|uniref:RSN1_TM domain-containing protein n=1 Tax=Echinostoma caproni TaxID=27848 RepID=A0A183BEV5_9TREM|nr:unnamed protein product [Echinostoma caproni]
MCLSTVSRCFYIRLFSVDLRLQVLTALSVLAVTTSLASLFLRFGSDLVFDKQPEFSQPSVGTKASSTQADTSGEEPTRLTITTGDRSALEFTLIYTMWNTYMAALALIYSPAADASREVLFKDNPSVSMMNDSDEEVVYE